MKACKLKHTVTIQSKSLSQDTFGQPLETWTTEASVRAFVEPLTGQELFRAQQVNAATTTRITIRYRAGMDASMRIVFESVNYNIQNIIDPEMNHAWLVMMCGSGLNNG